MNQTSRPAAVDRCIRTLIGRGRPKLAVPMLLLAGASLAAATARAEASPESQALASCVARHFVDSDATPIAQLMALMIVDTQSTSDPVKRAFDAQNAAIYASVAALIERLTERDCPVEVKAVAATQPSGGAFAVLFEQLTDFTQRVITPAMDKMAVTVGVELLKSLDTQVTVDLFGASAVTTRAAPLHPLPQ